MAQARKGRLNYRCPVCFMRDIDIDLFYEVEKDEFYCLRCNFIGDEKRVLTLNQTAKKKYGFLMTRFTKFEDDDE